MLPESYFSHHSDKILNRDNIREERLVWVHGVRNFSTLSKARYVTLSGVAGT